MSKDKDKNKKDDVGGKNNPKKHIDVEPTYESVTEIALSYLEERSPLTIAQRKSKSLTMRRYKTKIAMARKRAAKRKASPEKLKSRAQRKARNLIKQRLMKSKKYSDMSTAEKISLDKRLQRIPKAAIDRLTKRQLPQVKKAEIQRLASRNMKKEDLEFDFLMDQIDEAVQDQDIADIKGTQPAKYYKGLGQSTKEKRDVHFKKSASMDDDNPSAYKSAPGDSDAKTKPSTHTKRYHKMYTKENGVNIDRRFKVYRPKTNTFFESNEGIDDLHDLIESIDLMMEDTEKTLKNKAKETGISYSILKKVFDRGVAAWRTGHRTGTTPVQWGLARVNSFATKGKGTWGKADSDLASKVNNEDVAFESLDEKSGLWANIHAKRKRIKAGSGEKMRKPDSEGAPSAQDFKDASESIEEWMEGLELLDESEILDKALSAIHRQVLKGIDAGDIAYDISRLVKDIKLSGRQLEKEYIKKYGATKKSKTPDVKSATKLKKKYGFNESKNPDDREWGTDSLTKIYKKDTPNEKNESSSLEKEIDRGSRVKFKKYSLTDGYYDVEGTFIGTDQTTGRMKIRDDSRKLHVVKHQNVNAI